MQSGRRILTQKIDFFLHFLRNLLILKNRVRQISKMFHNYAFGAWMAPDRKKGAFAPG